MRCEWQLRRHFLRALHLPSLQWRYPRSKFVAEGFSHIRSVYGAGRVLHFLELATNPANEDDGFDVHEGDEYKHILTPIFETKKILVEILEEVARIAFEPQETTLSERFFPKKPNDSRPAIGTPARSPLHILTANVERGNFLDKLPEVYSRFLDFPPSFPLRFYC